MANPTALHVVPGDFKDPQRVANAINQYAILKEVWISVKDFGAIGDGVTDDTKAIAAAIAAAATTGRGVYFPAKTYLTDVIILPAALSRFAGESKGATLKFKRQTYAANTALLTITSNT